MKLLTRTSFNISDVFTYDPEVAGCLRWNVDVMCGHNKKQYKVRKGDVAGGTGHGRYYTVRFNYRIYYNHRIVWELFNGDIPEGLVVDHEDQDSHNNLIQNLRLLPHSVNCRNSKRSSANTSGATGVSFQKDIQAWRASWMEAGKRKAKSFRVSIFGVDEALRLAKEWRRAMIEKENKQGAGYTERHGK
jgi:hypothetical protein